MLACYVHMSSMIACLQCRELESLPVAARGPLYGVPFGVKDNIDVAGLPTTASCDAYRYTPAESAPTVQALLDAGEPPSEPLRQASDFRAQPTTTMKLPQMRDQHQCCLAPPSLLTCMVHASQQQTTSSDTAQPLHWSCHADWLAPDTMR